MDGAIHAAATTEQAAVGRGSRTKAKRSAKPGGFAGLAPRSPAEGQIGKLAQGRIVLHHEAQLDRANLDGAIGAATEKLPASVRLVVGDEQD